MSDDKTEWRIEKDSMGEMKVPANALYQAQTQRAVENFPISGITEPVAFINAFMILKRSAAVANMRVGLLDKDKADAIVWAADEVLAGRYIDQFVVDVFQAGAGTSFNMNCNEVLASLALKKLGRDQGDKYVHPNDHVNMGQSTNDTVPTSTRIAARIGLDGLLPVVAKLADSFAKKGDEFDHIMKSGRTHLQDAVPVRLGQEFKAYAETLRKCHKLIDFGRDSVTVLGIGGSATGTGLNTHPDYAKTIVEELGKFTGIPFTHSPDMREAMQSQLPIIHVSSTLRALALEMTRIANDLRLLSSGPTTGFAEIVLPAVQPGSSIMPGKVNPVMAEMLNQVMFHVIGNDTTVALCAQAGQMELNVMMPVIAYNLVQNIHILTSSLDVFRTKCVDGITADEKRCRDYAMKSVGLATILNTYIGYDKAAQLAKESVATGKSTPELILEKNLMTKEELDKVLDTFTVTEPGIPGKTN